MNLKKVIFTIRILNIHFIINCNKDLNTIKGRLGGVAKKFTLLNTYATINNYLLFSLL
jgi:hypothetical protein